MSFNQLKNRENQANRHYIFSNLSHVFKSWKKATNFGKSEEFIPIRITQKTAISLKGGELLRKQSVQVSLLGR